MSVLVRASNQMLLDETERLAVLSKHCDFLERDPPLEESSCVCRSIHDALCVVRSLVKKKAGKFAIRPKRQV